MPILIAKLWRLVQHCRLFNTVANPALDFCLPKHAQGQCAQLCFATSDPFGRASRRFEQLRGFARNSRLGVLQEASLAEALLVDQALRVDSTTSGSFFSFH